MIPGRLSIIESGRESDVFVRLSRVCRAGKFARMYNIRLIYVYNVREVERARRVPSVLCSMAICFLCVGK